MESYTTDSLVQPGRATAWNAIYSTRLAAADIIPQRHDFSAGLKLGHLGRVGLAKLVTGCCTIRRTAEHIDCGSPQLYSFIIQAKGRGLFAQGEHETMLSAGDFTLCDHARPHLRVVDEDAEMLLVRVPADVIRSYLPCPELLCGKRLPAREGLTPTAMAMTCNLWRQVERGFATTGYEETVAHQLLELIGISYDTVFGALSDERPGGGALFGRIRGYVEDNLRDGHLTVPAVAVALDVPPSDVRMSFARRNDSLRGYILRRRLEEIARQIRDPKWRALTVSEIAYGWGFNSGAHFSRSFRARFGVTPMDYRRQAVN